MIGEPAAAGSERAWKRAELLQHAWSLDAAGEIRTLATLLTTMPESELFDEPELGFLLARTLRRIGERNSALELVERLAVPLASQSGKRLARRRTFLEGALHFEFGQMDRAHEIYIRLLQDSIRAKDEWTEAMALNGLANIDSLLCRFPEALALHHRALIVDLKLSRHDAAMGLNNLAATYREMGFPDEAESCLVRSMGISAEAGDREMYAFSGIMRAQLMAEHGDTRLATESAARVFEVLKSEGIAIDPFREADMLHIQAEIARRDGRLGDARQLLDQARAMAMTPGVAWILADVWSEEMRLALAEGRRREAETAAEEAAQIFRRIGSAIRAEMVLAELT